MEMKDAYKFGNPTLAKMVREGRTVDPVILTRFSTSLALVVLPLWPEAPRCVRMALKGSVRPGLVRWYVQMALWWNEHTKGKKWYDHYRKGNAIETVLNSLTPTMVSALKASAAAQSAYGNWNVFSKWQDERLTFLLDQEAARTR